MALLDVSEVLDDPAFQEEKPLLRITQNEYVDERGRRQTREMVDEFRAVVTPAGGYDKPERVPEADRALALGPIFVYTTAELKAGEHHVEWNGNRYLVYGIKDWSHFGGGSGYVRASCHPRVIGSQR